jgi:hypothetical protein
VVLDPSSSSSACEGGGCRVAVTVISRCESRPLLHRVATIVDEGKRRAERVRSVCGAERSKGQWAKESENGNRGAPLPAGGVGV